MIRHLTTSMLALAVLLIPMSASALESPLLGDELVVELDWKRAGVARTFGARSTQWWGGASFDGDALAITPELGFGQRLLDGGPGRAALRLDLIGSTPVLLRAPAALAIRAEGALLLELDNRRIDWILGPRVDLAASLSDAQGRTDLALVIGASAPIARHRLGLTSALGYTLGGAGRGAVLATVGLRFQWALRR